MRRRAQTKAISMQIYDANMAQQKIYIFLSLQMRIHDNA
jgi:hypothetical protein